MKPSAIVLAMLMMCASMASARTNRYRDLGVGLLLGGLVVAAAGAPMMARGIALDGTASCAAWPMTTEVCGEQARAFKAAGASLLGVGLAVSLSGGVLLGVGSREVGR